MKKNNHTKMNTTYHKKECTEVTHSEESIPNLKKNEKKKIVKKIKTTMSTNEDIIN